MDSREVLPTRMVLDGSYRILRVVGSGGFGITYEAEDINLGTMVAIKEYYPYDFGERAGTMSVRPRSDRHKQTFDWGKANFLEEARTLARFEHISIVRVTRVFEANSTAYMVMRFERGASFEHWLRSLGRLPTQAELDRIVAPLLDALEMLHAADFLHRDIAPDNIIVRADGTPVLLDFGAARRAVAEMSQVMTGIVKAGYSPHEQYSSDGRLQGPWSDLYALGGTLYRAIAGKHPEEATLRFDEDRMPPAAQIGRGQYRPGFLAAIDTCLKVRHSERPRSVAEVRPMLLDEDRRLSLNRFVEALKPSTGPARSAPSRCTRRRRRVGSLADHLGRGDRDPGRGIRRLLVHAATNRPRRDRGAGKTRRRGQATGGLGGQERGRRRPRRSAKASSSGRRSWKPSARRRPRRSAKPISRRRNGRRRQRTSVRPS